MKIPGQSYILTIVSAVSFFWLIAIVGGSIILTLLYVGWKKYQAEKRKEKQEREKE